MKSSMPKRLLSGVVALLLLVLTCLPTMAASQANPKKTPVLVITGFSAYPLDNPDGSMAFPIKQPRILEAVKQALPYLRALLEGPKTQTNFDTFYRRAIPIVTDLFEPVTCNPDGSIKHEDVVLSYQYPESAAHYPVGSKEYNNAFNNPLYVQLIEDVGADNVYIYGLDWRKDPFLLADEINDWVQHIKAETGAPKVSIAGISMGGVMVSTYIAKYGTKDISNITMISAAFTGVAYVGELFKGNMEFNKADLLTMLDRMVGVEALSKVLGSTEILEKVIGLLDDFLYYEQDKLYTDFVLPAFGYCLGFWSFVPNEDLKEAKDYIYAHYTGTPQEKAVLNAKIDAYQLVQKNVKSTFQRAQRQGVSVAVISNYNLPMPPVSPDSAYNGDQVIETKHTSGGATVAELGKTLPESTTPNKYRSPDNVIDASTCMFPESTWFIKDMEHVAFTKTENLADLYSYIMTSKKQVDIDDNPDFPQFMIYDPSTQILAPMNLTIGDVDRNGVCNLADARKALRHLKGIEEMSSISKKAADVNQSKTVNDADITRMMKNYMQTVDKIDEIRDKLIASGIPEEKIPELFPFNPNDIPAEWRDALLHPNLPKIA